MKPSVLLLIDVQQGLDDPYWGKRNNPQAEQRMAELLDAWRKINWPIIHVKHHSTNPNSPLRPELPGNQFKPEVQPLPDEQIFTKTVNSAFIGTDLEDYLREQGLNHLVVVGLTTDHCVSTSVRMAGNLGFNVKLVADATATFERRGINGELITAEEMHQIHLASLHEEFCTVVNAHDVLTALPKIS
ncbi:cysteine hydrolase family protein [Tunicatimonas pelagia]|uniref:cysteine hydrolase family protein n=1 Tax=Tunicatimonas pelagia TaxID=931531 RepID=UPI0026664306|nr:cysteine hydrolase family protein [Tunicatimonas pelagia]WKN41559.1 cysteine hydrolase family protein [Tunicatimonas pelagia]